MSYVNPPLVSEREKGTDEDCVPCSALMLVLAHSPGKAPATLREAELLRRAAGYGTEGGTSVETIAIGIRKRYGFTPVIRETFAGMWSLLTAGPRAQRLARHSRAP